LDNYGTHKTPAVKRWFLRHPEYHLHFTPTSESCLNQVERFFAAITEDRIRRGVFTSVPQLERAIADYLTEHNKNPKPFVWTADADAILERLKMVCERTSYSGLGAPG
jgi:transposase